MSTSRAWAPIAAASALVFCMLLFACTPLLASARPASAASHRRAASALSHRRAASALSYWRVASALSYWRVASAASRAQRASHSPLSSRQLWATIDVCNPHDQPDTIGIRGSMPGERSTGGTLYMRFQVQYLDAASGKWSYVAQGADSGFVKIGAASTARQAGRSFQFAIVPGKPAFTLRGVVTFQWRRGSKVLLSATRSTSAGHKSVAGADPKGYSAASCTLP